MKIGSNFNSVSCERYSPKEIINFGLEVVVFGYEKCDPLHYYGPESRDFNILHYIIKGSGTLSINNREYNLNAGDGFYIPAHTRSYYIASHDNPWEYRWVSFKGVQANHIMKRTSISIENPVFRYDKDDFFSKTMQEAYNNTKDNIADDIYALSYAYLILAKLVNEFYKVDNPCDSKASEHIKKSMTFIQNNYNRDIKIADIANQILLNRSYLYKIFKHHLGMSPKQYIDNIRISHAKELLLRGHSITDVAVKVGFNDPFYFSKIFKKKVGISPRDYNSR